MRDEAYRTLEAIRRGDHQQLAARERWIEAFKTIRWAVETDAGPALTPAGLQACDELAGRQIVEPVD